MCTQSLDYPSPPPPKPIPLMICLIHHCMHPLAECIMPSTHEEYMSVTEGNTTIILMYLGKWLTFWCGLSCLMTWGLATPPIHTTLKFELDIGTFICVEIISLCAKLYKLSQPTCTSEKPWAKRMVRTIRTLSPHILKVIRKGPGGNNKGLQLTKDVTELSWNIFAINIPLSAVATNVSLTWQWLGKGSWEVANRGGTEQQDGLATTSWTH